MACFFVLHNTNDGIKEMSQQVYKLIDGLLNPIRKDLLKLADVPDIGIDLLIEPIALMRENGEQVQSPNLALEAVLKRGKVT